jgi:uncharacterized membrane protein
MSSNEKLKAQRERLIQRNERYAHWQRRWLPLLVLFLFIYTSLPIAAPALMKVGAKAPAGVIYTIYSPLCHQFAFRSMFLFGEQTFYPREQTSGSSKSFDERAAESPTFVALYTEKRRNEIADQMGSEAAAAYEFRGAAELNEWDSTLQAAAKSFRGDAQMGYKVALCARDIAIYGAMTIGGILFAFVRRRIRPVPLLLYVILGLGPMGLDGFSQLLGYPPFELWPPRESPMEFRILTGAIFGFMNIWLTFPYLERSTQAKASLMQETITTIRESD